MLPAHAGMILVRSFIVYAALDVTRTRGDDPTLSQPPLFQG